MESILQLYARLFSYPDAFCFDTGQNLSSNLSGYSAEIAEQARPFFTFLQETGLSRIEERFTYTFDLNADNCLEVGWHLYGEDYRRGRFLAAMRRNLMENHVEESLELPDHLSHCLRLIAVSSDREIQSFVREQLNPVVRKLAGQLDAENPYQSLMVSLHAFLSDHFGDSGSKLPPVEVMEALKQPHWSAGNSG